MRRRAGSFALGVTLCLGAMFSVATGPAALGQEGESRPARYAGRPLADVLRELGSKGLTILFTAAVVRPELTVREEPASDDPRRALDEMLAPLHLVAREGPGGVLVIVAAPASRQPKASVAGGVVPPLPYLEEEIVVRPSRLSLLEERPGSAFALSRDDIDRLPHLGGDVLRAASLLPGATANDVTAQLTIHGGRRDETSVVLDGQELYDAYHLEDYDRALSVVPALALEAATLDTGAYAASWGDRMSGVLDLRTVEPGAVRHFVLAASVVDLLASAAGSWGGDRDGGWSVMARRGSIDLASRFFGNEDPGFWDALGKAEIGTPAGRFTFHLLTSDDELELDRTESDSFDRLENEYTSNYAWVTHQASPSDRLLVETSLSWADVRRRRAGATSEEKGDFDVSDHRDLDVRAISQSWIFDDGGGRQEPRWGFELRRYDAAFDYASHLDPEFVILAPFSPQRASEHAFDGTLDGDHAGAWVTDRVRLFGPLSAEVGLRWDRHDWTGETLWSPRLNLGWRLDQRSVLRASWGRFFQSQRPYELQVEDGETTLFPAERSTHTVLGYEASFGGRGPGLQGLRLELYHRDVDRPRPRYENLLEPLNFLPEIEPDRVRITPESSNAEGVELLLRGRAGARLGGWLAYSYSRAEDRIDGDQVPRTVDQPHAATLGLDYRPGARTSLALAWRWRTGWPTTPVRPIVVPDPEDPGELEHQLAFGRLSSERLGVYHRVDLRASHRVELERGSLLMYVDVQNLYDRRNAAGFDFTIDTETGVVTREREAWPGIFPSIGVVWEF